jgi:hypothetical protein
MTSQKLRDKSRRNFLQSVGAGVPTLSLLMNSAAPGGALRSAQSVDPARFTPLDLTKLYNCSPREFGPRDRARRLSGEAAQDGLVRVPAGEQSFWGIPFRLGAEGIDRKSWLLLSTRPEKHAARRVTIPLGRRAAFVCLAAFCDWDENETPPPVEDAVEKVGQLLGEAVLVYDDGSEQPLPIRRRFEVNSPSVFWGHASYAAHPHRKDSVFELSGPLNSAREWGYRQTLVGEAAYQSGPDGRSLTLVWVSALANPKPDRAVKELRLEAKSEDPLIVCGVTLFHGREHPLRHERRSLYRFTLPEANAENAGRWEVDVDLGVVARTYVLPEFDPGAWLAAAGRGLGEPRKIIRAARHLYAEIAASPEATVTLRDAQEGRSYLFSLREAAPGRELEARPAGARVEILEREKAWLHGRVVDEATGRPTPVRLAFRSRNGRYIPPYGHRSEVNDAWFQDYGADVKLMDSHFAYVDGTFQIELPAGEVFVEITKGFEYDAVRERLRIEPQQRELDLRVRRHADFRSKGWVTADTHTHFLSPSTAVLEGQAEGVNLVNLLAAQWGDLFTNVGDLAHGALVSRDGETMVQVSTENRQHLLGHLGLLGVEGPPVFPMSASGPGESFVGEPLWTSLAEWADACREREGLVVAVHFPYPTAELAADIALGKIDAVELYPYGPHFSTLRFLDWYRYLNCGYRLTAVGGTDKMGAYMPVGANRTYAFLGDKEFNFANWARAVRSGNTFMTTGPLLFLKVDGRVPGDEIKLGAGGGTLEVELEARSFVPFHRVEVVLNGRVVAAREEANGTRELALREKVRVPGPGWMAARCASKLGPTAAGLSIQAHTSPVYFTVPGEELFSAPAATYMLTLIEGAETWAETLATRPDGERFARVRKTFADAREHLHRRLHAHGIAH